MGAGIAESREIGPRCSADLRSARPSMATNASAGFEPCGTTADEPTTEHTRVLDLDSTAPVSIDGATAIFADAYARTDDGNALRFDSDVPLFLVGVYSRTDARHALAAAGYDADDIDRAFENGKWMSRTKNDHATAAVRVAENEEGDQ